MILRPFDRRGGREREILEPIACKRARWRGEYRYYSNESLIPRPMNRFGATYRQYLALEIAKSSLASCAPGCLLSLEQKLRAAASRKLLSFSRSI